MIKTKESIFRTIKDNQNTISQFGVKKLGIFGSFVRGEQNAESDIDLLIEFDQGQKTFDNFMDISFFLEELLERPVELVTDDSLSPYLRPYILKEVEYVIVRS
jgi:predicted nucleotidyltransferase